MAQNKITPLMKQYNAIKAQHKDAILLYRMGDFYETFYDDAKLLSKILGIALTKRGGEDATPLAGFPYHALDAHLYKLLKAGHKVARCEQVEDPKTAKGVVKRDIVEIHTPGSTLSDKILDHRHNNFICSILIDDQKAGLAFADISTGEFITLETEVDKIKQYISDYQAKEILSPKKQSADLEQILAAVFNGLMSGEDDWFYDESFCRELLLKQFKTHSLKGFGIEDKALAICASGALLNYLKNNYKNDICHFTTITTLETGNFMSLDTATKRNLEILETINDSSGKATLVSILDSCKTSMGSRLIRNWISNPLIDQKSIQERLDLVDLFFNSSDLRSELRSIFAEIGDIERLLSRISTGKCSARDLLFLKNSLQQIGPLTDILDRFKNKQLSNLSDQFQGVDEISSLIEKAINPEAPHTLTEGNIIRTGYHGELDKLKDVSISGKDYIAKMQSEERSKTGITSLKIAYNKVFGYYIDITNTHKSKVPDHYIRKQTLVNSERYITPELKEYEEMVLGAEEKINTLEYQLFQDIREQIITELSAIQTNARLIAQIDVLSNYAELSESFTYCKPLIEDSNRLYFKNGRHPVVEHHLEPGAVFTKNDCSLDPENDQIMVITGPNMAGKSTYLRQCGLIVLMAQIGCFVPADDATIGICDRIFTRVGASDNLASGESTFLVEMNEAANILNNCSRKSLILFDELGRGTSTFDGLSIAWSVIEYLHNQSEKAAKTLFATHYHELTELEMLLSRVKNYNVAVEEYDDQVIFLRKIIPGGSDNSYGIQVAQMAGLPRPVIERAKEILFNLESNEINPTTQRPRLASRQNGRHVDVNQTSLFDDRKSKVHSDIADRLKSISIDDLTPLEALNKLNELKKMI